MNIQCDEILLLDADRDCEPLLRRCAEEIHSELICATTCAEALALIRGHHERLRFCVVDVDPGAHALALVEAFSACATAPPLIVLTSLEETYMRPIAAAHGAAACLGKPLDPRRLAQVLETSRPRYLTCDRWGNVTGVERCEHSNRDVCFDGISGKLAATAAA